MNLNVPLAALVLLAAASAPLVAQTATAVQTGRSSRGRKEAMLLFISGG